MRAWRSPVGLGPALDGGVGPERIGPRIALRSVEEGRGHQRVGRRDHGVGHPVGVGRVPDGPKSGCRLVVALSMLASQAALWESTGSPEMSVFHTLSAGNIGQPGAPGSGRTRGGRAPGVQQGQAAADHGRHHRRRDPCLRRSTHVICPGTTLPPPPAVSIPSSTAHPGRLPGRRRPGGQRRTRPPRSRRTRDPIELGPHRMSRQFGVLGDRHATPPVGGVAHRHRPGRNHPLVGDGVGGHRGLARRTRRGSRPRRAPRWPMRRRPPDRPGAGGGRRAGPTRPRGPVWSAAR